METAETTETPIFKVIAKNSVFKKDKMFGFIESYSANVTCGVLGHMQILNKEVKADNTIRLIAQTFSKKDVDRQQP